MANSRDSSRTGLILGAVMIIGALVLFAANLVTSAVTFPLMGAGIGVLLFGLYDRNARKR